VSKKASITVVDNKVFYNGEPYAELRYLHSRHSEKRGVSHRGLAIYYYLQKKEVWIYPERGWRIAQSEKQRFTLEELNVALNEPVPGSLTTGAGHVAPDKFTII